MKSAQKIHSSSRAGSGSTQKFIEIEDITEDVVLLARGNACLVIEVQATNFSLLSIEEQHAKIFSYSSLLNSLSFPIQILIRNKPVDISSYIKRLDAESQKIALASQLQNQAAGGQHEKRVAYIKQYRDFVENLIKVNTVLDKTFYIVLSFSSLEKGAMLKKDKVFIEAKASLHTKAESLFTQLQRLSLPSKILGKDALIKLFYEIYNPSYTHGEIVNIAAATKTPVIMTEKPINQPTI